MPRAVSLNDAVVDLIRRKVEELDFDELFEPAFMAKDGDEYVVLYAGGSKAKHFERKKDAKAYLDWYRSEYESN